ncbi:MAG: hypothetical protein Q9195_002913 [Heterodermia aff. obscurata]
MSPPGSPKPTQGGSFQAFESANTPIQNTPSESTKDSNPFAPLQDLSDMTDSLRESTQTAAPAAPKKQTIAQIEASLKARREANRARDAATAAAQQAALEQEAPATGTPKRLRSPSPETSQKRTREAMDLDQPTTDAGKAVELTPIQKIRQLNLGDLNFPTNTAFKCSMCVDQQPIVGGRIAKGYSINFFIDEGQYGLPHIRLLFRANKPGMLNQDLASRVEDQEQFSICYYPGKLSTDSNEVMIAAFQGQNITPAEVPPGTKDKEVLDTINNDHERRKLIRLVFRINSHEQCGAVNLDTWMGGLGRSVAANMENLLTGRYTIAVWLIQTVGLIKALDSFHLALEARVPLLHQYYDSGLLAPVLDLENTPPIEKIGNGMYIIYPKKLDEQGREMRDASQRPVYDTNAPPASFRSLPFVTDWVNTEHFLIYNALSVIREHQYQHDQVVHFAYVDFKVFIKKMPGFKIGTEVIHVDRTQYSPKQREITSSFLVYFRTPSRDGVKETPPQEGTRVRIMFPENPKQKKSEEKRRIWNGMIIRRDIEDFKKTGCDFCVLASKPSNTSFQHAHDDLKYLPDGELQSVSLKITLSTKPASREIKAVKEFSTSSNPQMECLRDLLIRKADPNRKYPTVDITGGPNNNPDLKKIFHHRIQAIQGLNPQQRKALHGLSKIPMGIHIVEGPPGTAKTTMIARAVWPLVEVGHRICCFTTTNTAADHLTTEITNACPPEMKGRVVLRMNIAAVEDLMIKRSSEFDREMPVDEQLQQLPKEQQFDEPEDRDPLYAMGLEQINQAVMENDALFDELYDEFMEQNKAREEAFRLLREKANQGGSLNVPLATTLAYRIWELEMQDHIAATKEYDAEYQARTQGLDPMAVTDAVSDMRSVEERSQSGQFKKYREFYINQDGRIYGATKRMFKSLTKDMAMRVMKQVHILIMTANNAGSELAELGFEPTLLICEEGGQANIASFCVPLTVFSGWLACAIFGDKQQLQRDSFGSRFNEVSENGRLSILGLLGHKRFPSHKLDVQYLMDPDIARFPNLRFYQGTLINGPNTELSNPTKAILRRVSKEKLKIRASTFWMVDVQNGVSYREAGSSSLQNDENAYAIHQQVSMLLDEGIQAHQITILVYYRAQLKNLAKLLKRVTADGKIERMCSNITTVDSFHGSHSDVIILDMVAVGRDSWSGKSQVPVVEDVYEEGAVVENAEDPEIGKSRVFAKYTKYTQYAKNCHRLNLACTRAKMGFIVFCHTKSMLATSRITKAGNGTQYEKSDLAALARDAQDRRIVVGVTGNQESPRGSLQQRKRSPYG